ncbi:oxidoreductase [Guyanagaster necrorhizus]|uniref:3-dehydrosphinganine reductase n=1 Tax=Guyanagaster necrorhizus TaxID=856835 RepID=A0A9P8APX4_9AGAR|nr:oxidoreductase [Guyanagaster necrorhizus MCA 3950]KAG7443793.1 oxidoreductase [Guyanagaster necrorhizus MCA 3950]
MLRFPFNRNKWDPKGKHCYVTGGSQGLGLSVALLLVKLGADVSIVARNEDKLRAAHAEMEKARQLPSQILRWYSYDLSECKSSEAALEAASEGHNGRCPDALLLCAGAAVPGFFVEEDETSMRKGMDNGYWVQAWSALAGAKRMVRENKAGKIVLVSSFLGYMSIMGYSSYAPAKHALRGLAETLRSEMLLYGISVHTFFPGTIYSPGYEAENKSKPKITLTIEETDGGQTPDKAAEGLLKGVQRGDFHISADLLGNIFRSSTRGATPRNHVFLDEIYSFIGWVILPIWRRSVDSTIKGHRQEHRSYLAEKGLLS